MLATDPGGLDVFAINLEVFRAAMTRENHTLKRALTDPRILSGVGNAYSDEILHAAKLSPIQQTGKLTAEQWERLFSETRSVMQLWIDRLQTEDTATKFPEKSHGLPGRHGGTRTIPGLPCPVCGRPIQRIRYAGNETNY